LSSDNGWRKNLKKGINTSQREQEVAKLKRQLAEQAEELEIVKNAATYFAKNLKKIATNLCSKTCCTSVSLVWLRCSRYPEVGFITGLSIVTRLFSATQVGKNLMQR